MIECRGVAKSYGAKIALHSLELTIGCGICGLLGPNGAGKSTLIGIITGLITPDAGSVVIDGLDIRRDSSIFHQKIGVLPDDLGLFSSLSIQENLSAIGPIYGLSREETAMRADSLLEALELQQRSATSIRDCSYGMKKKTALAMALLHNPRVLVLDEPFEGVDLASSYRIRQLLNTFAERGAAILLTTHVLPILESLASRILMLQNGRLIWDSSQRPPAGSLEETYFEHVGWPVEKEMAWLGF